MPIGSGRVGGFGVKAAPGNKGPHRGLAWRTPRLSQFNAPAASPRIFDASVPTYPTAFADVRASNATYFNSSGVLSTASSNTQRIDYNPSTLALRGLLIEDARTNVVPTNDFTAGSQFNVTVGSTVTSLDGTSNAYPVTPTAISGKHWVANSGGLLPSTTNPTTFSVYVKANGYSQVGIVETNATFAAAVFSLASGGSVSGTFNSSPITVSNTSITDAGGGWFRISCTMDSGGANFGYFFGIYIFDGGWTNGTDPSAYNWTPNGTSGIIASFRQAEVATSVSSYIYTSGSSATRAADSYSFTLNPGATQLTFTFDDLSTQIVSGLTGGSTYTIPTNLNRPWILYIDDNSVAATNVGAAAGTSAVAGVGAALDNSIAAASGAATVSGVGAALGIGVGSAAGTSTVTATGAALGIGVGSAAGTSTVAATGAALGKGVGNAAGTSTVLATGQSTAASVAASAGVSTVSGVGAALAASIGVAAGTSTDTATGSSLAKGVGNAAGTSTALAVSGTVGAAAGTSTVIGVGAALFNAVGAAAGTSTVTATGTAALLAVGTAVGTSTVVATGRSLAAAVGNATGVGTAAGVGAAAGIFAAVGTAAGSSTVSGVGAASIFVQAIPPDPRASRGLRRIYPAAGVPGIYNADIFGGGTPGTTPDFSSGDFSGDFARTGTPATAGSGASIYGAAGALNKPLRRTTGPQMRRTYKYPVQLIPGGVYDKDIYGQNIYQSDS